VADLRPPVTGAHDYVPRPRAHWTAASACFCGHTGPLRIPQPPVWATPAAAATVVPAGRPGPRMEPLTRRRLRPAIAGQILQHHDAPPAPYLSPTDSGVTHHTTPSIDNNSTLRPLASFNPSSIVVGNGSSLPITSVGDSVLSGPFYLNNILLLSTNIDH
jgi:hypothetical protein